MNAPIYFDPNEDVTPDERKRRETCLAKATFATEALARAAAIQAEHQGGMQATGVTAYRCRFCDHWHLSRR